MSYQFLVPLCALAVALAAQAPNGQPAFEVASIKPAPPPDFSKPVFFGSRGGPGTDDPALYTCSNCDLPDLVSKAYDVPYYRMPNRGSFEKASFHVSAKVPPGTSAAQFRLMLQNLLAERFKLGVHREEKEMATYRLVILKGGPKMKESTEGPDAEVNQRPADIPKRPPGIHYDINNGTMEHFVTMLEGYVRGPVVDATGLKGKYNFDLSWALDEMPDKPDSDAGQTIFSAIQSQLGLKLESKKSLVEVLVIDHTEKLPTEN